MNNKIQKYLELNPNMAIIISGMIITLLMIFYIGWLTGWGRTATNTLGASLRNNGLFRTTPIGRTESFIPQSAVITRGIRNPSEPVPAGTPILAEEFSLVVENRVEVVGNDIIIFLVIQNQSNRPSLFRYRNSSIVLEDNVLNIYQPTSKGDNLSAVKQFSVGPREILGMDSTCNDTLYKLPQCIPRFIGPISSKSNKIMVKIDEFGPFNDIVVEIDLSDMSVSS